jgi:uncharacterized membrane protein
MARKEPTNRDDQDKIPGTWLLRMIEIVAAAVLILMAVYPIVAWKTLPDQMPMHYNAAGEIDRWSSKRELIFLPLTAVFIYVLL